MLNKSMMIQTTHFFSFFVNAELIFAQCAISRFEVLDATATQSLLIYCLLRTVRKKVQWLQLLSLRNVRKNGIESLALWYIIVIIGLLLFEHCVQNGLVCCSW
jgi:hypothetical protein